MSAEDEPAATEDDFLGGTVRLLQAARGHRAGLDAALLQALVPSDATGWAVELGTGAGAVAFSVAARAPGLSVVAVERDEGLAALARRALRLPQNGRFASRVTVVAADVTARRPERESAGLQDSSADFVLMNPPFALDGTVSASPVERRRSAHVAAAGDLQAWIRTASGLLKPRGRLFVIHRAEALPDLLAALGRGFGAVAVIPVHPRREDCANRVLMAATRASGKPLQLCPALVLHDPDGSWTAEADAVLRGRSAIRT
ncbi:tRNA1(Val) (adenine(37)-N6)-methyltransferase [Faunimonas sp. B44]|uniref:tRNA1(Val) (adenine(37)-N6)-methyltransferase n=1 Tax=Faunimonas sp. B44 TaxID=3461493 RepID=UPI004043B880